MERRMLDCFGPAEDRSEEHRQLRAAVWQTEQSIILPSGMSRREGVEPAAQFLAQSGWPVFERFTGGDVTPQFDGVLNISLSFVLTARERNITAAYHRLTEPLVEFLKHDLGVSSYTSSVDGAFCDGAYNIVVAGRKIAGTAQRWRILKPCASGSPQATAVLAHAALLIGRDLGPALTAVNRFLEASGTERRIDPDAHASVAELAGPSMGEPGVFAARLARFLREELAALPPPQS